MPFPFLLWGAAAAAAAVGVKKGYDAYCDNDKAKKIGERAERRYERAKESLESDKEITQNTLVNLGKFKVNVLNNQVKYCLERYKNAKFKMTVHIDNIQNVENQIQYSSEFTNVAAIGAGVGGLGVAGGMFALGGIALAPVLAIGGFFLASKAEETLSQARDYSSEVDNAIAKMNIIKTDLNTVRKSCEDITNHINKALDIFERVKTDNESNPNFERMILAGIALIKLINIPVMYSDGKINHNVHVECEDCFVELD